MQSEAVFYGIGLSIAGIWLIGMGLWLSLGINRTWWQWRVLPFQEGYFWAGIPAGIAIIFAAIVVILPSASTIQEVFFWISMGFVLIAIIFSLGPPKFLKPKWLRDLEERYPHHIIRVLRDCARQLSKEEWLEIVHDPVLLQQWADKEVQKMDSY